MSKKSNKSTRVLSAYEQIKELREAQKSEWTYERHQKILKLQWKK